MDTKATGGVPGSLLTALMSTHHNSPLQSDYTETTMNRYRDHAATLSAGVRADGITLPNTAAAIAHRARPLPVGGPEWYSVGGAPDTRRRGMEKVPEKVTSQHPSLSHQQFNDNHALEHVLDVEHHNFDRAHRGHQAVFAGGWNEGGNIVLDHSTVFKQEAPAQQAARDSGERAYFDAQNIESKDSETGEPLP